ncbi:MAG: CHASE2 domain-containing protein [Chthoniobacterales bacterium]
MARPSPWLTLVFLLVGLLLLREPRFAQVEEFFLRWLLGHSRASAASVPLTVVEIGKDPLMDLKQPQKSGSPAATGSREGAPVSPLEFALFLQSVLDFQPGVVAFENVLKWRETDKDQEQVFLDQAMRVPKLLLAAELSENPDPDAPGAEIRGFPHVTGNRGNLPAFSGIGRQPGEDLRLISTPGFVNLPAQVSSAIRVPLLFLYRGEVVPSFPLQAMLLWLRATPADVKVVLGSHIALPQDRRIPIASDGSLLVDPNGSKAAHRLSLNELLLAAQQRETGGSSSQQAPEIRDHVVLARTPANPLSPPDLFSAAIATLQSGRYLRRISPVFDWAVLLVLSVTAGVIRKVARTDLVLCGIAFTAAYCLVALGTLSRWNVWLPGIFPLCVAWAAILTAFFRRRKKDSKPGSISPIPPPIA